MYIRKIDVGKDGHTCSFKTCILRKAAPFVSTSNTLATTYFAELKHAKIFQKVLRF